MSGQRWVAPESTIERQKWKPPGMESNSAQTVTKDEDSFEGAKACSLTCPYSDHLPLVLTPVVLSYTTSRRRFCFDNMWIREDKCREIVINSWSRTIGLDMLGRIEVCGADLWQWGRGYNKEFQRRIDTHSCGVVRTEKHSCGVIWQIRNLFKRSIGRVGLGHTVYISGLSCSMTKQKIRELSWFENDPGASFVNISCLPALLNSSCLHKFSNLCDLSTHATHTHVCRVWLDQIEYCHVGTRLSHAPCGHFVNEGCNGELKCNFCHCICNDEVVRSFHLRITIADGSAKVLTWCTGHTATELLQITPDEFCELNMNPLVSIT
nr:Zinc finger protein like [Ipomoea batatas]